MYLDRVMSLFKNKVFSESGSSELKAEQATYMLFRDLLEELEGKWNIQNFLLCYII